MTADRQRQAAEVLREHVITGFQPDGWTCRCGTTSGDRGGHLAAALAPLIGQWREQDRAEGAVEAQRRARAEELVEVGRAFSSLNPLAFGDWLIGRTRAAKTEWRDRAAALREGQAT